MKTNVTALLAIAFLYLFYAEAAKASDPPRANLALWLKADTGVSTNADEAVKGWADQSGSALPHDGTAVGTPRLGMCEFLNGPKPMVSFNGISDGIVLANVGGLELTNLTIYIVASESASSVSRIFVSVFDASLVGPVPVAGLALGISDVTYDGVKWFTSYSPDSLESAGYTLTPGVPNLITASYEGADGYKAMFLSTNFVNSEIGVALPVYTTNTTATIGQLTAAGGQHLAGSIAEILIYAGVSESQNARVWGYLDEKYFGISNSVPIGAIGNNPASRVSTQTAPLIENQQMPPGAGVQTNISHVSKAQSKAHRWASAKFGETLSVESTDISVAHFGEDSTTPPFSFVYGGKSSMDFLTTWPVERSTRRLDVQRTEYTLVFTDPKTGLVVRCVGVEYRDFPTVEWTVYFKNSGSEDTPILEQIQPLDLSIQRGPIGEYMLHLIVGNRLVTTALKPDTFRQFGLGGGGVSPYLNFELPGEGLITALSWPGDLGCEFARDRGVGLRIHGGQANTHFKLHPGEEVRTPMIVVQFYNGEFINGQNIWRRWMIAHNMPKPGGQPLTPQFSASSAYQYDEMVNATEENQEMFISRYIAEGLKPDFWWMDAGWYPPNISTNGAEAWGITGTWVPDKRRFPGGLRAITDFAHARGIKNIVWFQPERVSPGTWLYEHHPEWLIGADGRDKLFDFGNPEALKWAVNYFGQFIKDQGIDIFRMDTNIGFSSYWRKNDAPDRQGITEIKHVTGYLAFLDGLLRQDPGLRIDHWRTDMETLRRSAPLILDLDYNPSGEQCANYWRSLWFPWHGLCSLKLDSYDFRSMMCTAIVSGWDLRNHELNTKLGDRLIHEWRDIAPDYFGDYYPLTPYSLDNNTWMAWQFDRPETGEGVIQAFRRQESPQDVVVFKLNGLEGTARYKLTNFDVKGSTVASGKALMENGFKIEIDDKPGAAVVTYRRL